MDDIILVVGICCFVMGAIVGIALPHMFSTDLEPCMRYENRFDNKVFVEIADECYIDFTNEEYVGGEFLSFDRLFMLDSQRPWEENVYLVLDNGGKVK